MKLKHISVLLLFLYSGTAAQVYTIDNTIPVAEEDVTYIDPWAGGINSGQYSKMDVNDDQVEDLIVFDRTNNRISVFVVDENQQYIFDPFYSTIFPSGITDWMLLRDFNCDGLKDIFTSDPFGIRVFVNESTEDEFKWRIFNSREPGASPLLSKGFSDNPINIQLNASDLPSIDDLDGDGDLDILVFRFSSAATIEYHKNLSIENESSCDSLQFERITQTYGGLEECGCGEFAFNGESCPDDGGGRQEHQSGKSITTLDMDGDGDNELLIGEEECSFISFLSNEGNSLEADMNAATIIYPTPANPINIFLFPAAYYEDIDFDGVKDLIAAPNVPANINFGVDFQNSSWIYRNAGTDSNPSFEFIQRNFLQDQMLDFGENAAPAFYDYDNDGDLDMFVGAMLTDILSFESTIRVYRNIGSPNSPSFELEEDDLFGFSQVGLINLKPQFADIDGDGLVDLAFTGTSVNNGGTALYYLKAEEGIFEFDLSRVLLAFNQVGRNENVKVVDIDGDSFTDLLVGRSTGRLEYYRNSGTENMISYSLEDPTFYDLDFSPFRQNIAVEVADLNGDGALDLLTGDARGTLTFYEDFLSNLDAPVQGRTDLIRLGENAVNGYNFGSKLIPMAVNIFNEDLPSIVIGNGQGGLAILRNESAEAGSEDQLAGVYPNPVRIDQELKILSAISFRASIVNLVGQTVIEGLQVQANEELNLDVSGLTEGLYLLVPETSSDAKTIRFIVTR